MASSRKSGELSTLLTVIFAVITVAILYFAKSVVVPLALAILFAFLLTPVSELLERMRFPRVPAVTVVILAAGILVGVVGWAALIQLVDVTEHMSEYTYNIQQKIETLNRTKSTSFSRAEEELKRLNLQIGALHWHFLGLGGTDKTTGPEEPSSKPVPVQNVNENGRFQTVHGVLDIMVSAFLVVVFTFFILLQREDLRNRLIRLSGSGNLSLLTQTMNEANRRVSRYLGFQLLVNVCYGSIIFTVLHFIGLPHALLWGALAGVLRFIPYIGAPIGALLPTMFSLAVFPGWMPSLEIILIYFCLEVFTANFFEPRLYGKQTGLSPLAVLVAAVFWTLIWGPIGLILSIPLTVCLVVIGSRVPTLRFLTVLLGDQPAMQPEAQFYQRLLAGDEQEAGAVMEAYLKENSIADLYDRVLIPALYLFERDRHRNVLDDATIRFVTETTQELVEDLGVREEEGKLSDISAESASNGNSHEGKTTESIRKVACVAVRDDSDEIIATMLMHLLVNRGCSAEVIPPGHEKVLLEKISKTGADMVCLSALPPYTVSFVRRTYERLSAQMHSRILVGLWNYTGDLNRATKVIFRGQPGDAICTTLAQAVEAISPTKIEAPGTTPQNADAAPSDADVPIAHF